MAGQAHFDTAIEEAALSLGATPWQTFWRVTLPILLPGVVSGAVFAFVMSFDDVPVALFMGGGDVVTLSTPNPEALARDLAARFAELSPVVRDGAVRLERERGHELAARLVEEFPGRIDSVTVSRPTLEDVFLLRTDHRLYGGEEGAAS